MPLRGTLDLPSSDDTVLHICLGWLVRTSKHVCYGSHRTNVIAALQEVANPDLPKTSGFGRAAAGRTSCRPASADRCTSGIDRSGDRYRRCSVPVRLKGAAVETAPRPSGVDTAVRSAVRTRENDLFRHRSFWMTILGVAVTQHPQKGVFVGRGPCNVIAVPTWQARPDR